MKAGIIRCMQTEDYCPGTADFRAIREKTGAFSQTDEDSHRLSMSFREKNERTDPGRPGRRNQDFGLYTLRKSAALFEGAADFLPL